jgi:hypothetical protein
LHVGTHTLKQFLEFSQRSISLLSIGSANAMESHSGANAATKTMVCLAGTLDFDFKGKDLEQIASSDEHGN